MQMDPNSLKKSRAGDISKSLVATGLAVLLCFTLGVLAAKEQSYIFVLLVFVGKRSHTRVRSLESQAKLMSQMHEG